MKCPLIQKSIGVEVGEVFYEPLDCLKEECAWYSDTDKTCSVLLIAASLAGLVAAADALLDKMPHEEQFRR